MSNFAIDYTSRDFDSLKKDLITVIQTKLGQYGQAWEATDPSDFGVALVEAFAYVGDITNYYIDRVANEAYLTTAIQRSSILKLASALNYTPAGFIQAQVDLEVTNSTDEQIVIPQGTQFMVTVPLSDTSSTNLLFSTPSDYPILASGDGNTTITVYHGEEVSLRAENLATSGTDIDGEYLASSSSGLANQEYVLQNANPVDSTIDIFIDESGTWVNWKRVSHLYDRGPNDLVYEAVVNADNSVTIKFGDGVNGSVPSLGSEIKAKYVVVDGGGAVGNVPASLSGWTITSVPSFTVDISTLSVLSFTNPDSGSGGSDPESNDSIRQNAPKALTAMNRAVTLDDFANLALSVPGVGENKAAAYATVPTSVALYVAPQNTTYQSSFYPGFNSTNTEVSSDLTDLMSSVYSYIIDKAQIGTTVTVLPPEYVPVNVAIKYKRALGVPDSTIQSTLLNALYSNFGYDALSFYSLIFPENIESTLAPITPTTLLRVTELWMDDDSIGRKVLSPTQGTIYIFSDEVRAGTGLKGIRFYPWASLKGLTLSGSLTLNRTFDPLVDAYTVTTTGTSVTVTPVKVESTDILSYTLDGSVVANGIVSIPSVGSKVLAVTVTSEDLSESKTYSVTITKTA